jgi:transposase
MGREIEAVAPPRLEVRCSRRRRCGRCERLGARGWGAKKIAKELVGVARNTVRRYLRGGPAAEVQERPAARCLGDAARAEAVALLENEAERNAVVVAQLLAERGVEASVRTVPRMVADRRRELLAADVREGVLARRQGERLDGIASAFRRFGGVPLEVLGDIARCLVHGREREAQTVTFHPAYAAFCRDWDVQPRACQPYQDQFASSPSRAPGATRWPWPASSAVRT